MKDEMGFIFSELLVSFSIFLVIITVCIPLFTDVKYEQRLLAEKQTFYRELQNELNSQLRAGASLPNTIKISQGNTHAGMTFKEVDGFIEGCIDWTDTRGIRQNHCLYGYRND